MEAMGELYLLFIRKYEDMKVRASSRITDAQLCQVFLEVWDFMVEKKAPQELQREFFKQLMKQYDAETVPDLRGILTTNATNQNITSNENNNSNNENTNSNNSNGAQ